MDRSPADRRPEPSLPSDAAPATARPRRPFEPPAVLWTEPFQPVAYGLSCAKQSGQGGQCNTFPAIS